MTNSYDADAELNAYLSCAVDQALLLRIMVFIRDVGEEDRNTLERALRMVFDCVATSPLPRGFLETWGQSVDNRGNHPSASDGAPLHHLVGMIAHCTMDGGNMGETFVSELIGVDAAEAWAVEELNKLLKSKIKPSKSNRGAK